MALLMCNSPQPHHHCLLLLCRLVHTLPKFLDQGRIITSNRFVLNMGKDHHLQLRTFPPLFHNFKEFNIKAVAAHRYLLGTGESYGPTAQHMQDSPMFFIQPNYCA